MAVKEYCLKCFQMEYGSLQCRMTAGTLQEFNKMTVFMINYCFVFVVICTETKDKVLF